MQLKCSSWGAQAALQHLSKQLQNAPIDEQTRQQLQYIISHQLQQLLAGQVRLEAFIQDGTQNCSRNLKINLMNSWGEV